MKKTYNIIILLFSSLNLIANEAKNYNGIKLTTEKITKEEYSEREIEAFRILENYESYRPFSFNDANRNPLNKTPKRYKFEIED